MAQNKSYKELMELQGQSGGQQGTQAQSSNQMLDLILGRKPFQYNAQTDPAAQAARKTAARNAKAVTRDTLGQHAAMTGGVPSTAAVSAAAQAGNAALQQGTDRVAELEQLAYQNYQTEGQNMYNAYAAMQQQEDAEYQKKLAMAQLAASYGDTSGLKALGIDLSNYNAAGRTYYTPQNPQNPKPKDPEPVGGIPADVSDGWWVKYGGVLPEDVWAAAVAEYGEAELIAEGFKKAQQTNPKPGGSGGGHVTKPIPGKDFGTIAMG